MELSINNLEKETLRPPHSLHDFVLISVSPSLEIFKTRLDAALCSLL